MKKGMILAFIGVLAVGLALASTGSAGRTSAQGGPPAQIDAGAPAALNYQGLLLDSAGDPVPDGSYQLTLAIYDVATAGTALWSETQAVTVTAGLFNVLLGGSTALDPTWVDGRELWLGVTLAGEEEMVPRTRLTSVPYALNAGDVRGADIHPVSVAANTAVGDAVSGVTAATDGRGVYGLAGAATGQTFGVYGRADSTEGIGLFGEAMATSGGTYGVHGESDSTSGTGVFGYAAAPGGDTRGVAGQSDSTGGFGVYGYATATDGQTYGVAGVADSPRGTGVLGVAYAMSGTTSGLYGRADSTEGSGVVGWAASAAGKTYGVYGRAVSPDGVGVYGWASAASGIAPGVQGRSSSTSGRGVYGYAAAASGATYGIYGESASTDGTGVYGAAGAASGTTYGVYGESASPDGRGVYGYASAASGQAFGVYGLSAANPGSGVYGEASATSGQVFGVYGRARSTAGRGVYGVSEATTGDTCGVYGLSRSSGGTGVYGNAFADSGDTYGVYGQTNSPDGWAGYFHTYAGNGVHVSSAAGMVGLSVSGGTKNAVVATADGARLLYSEESSEVWFSDYGFGQLQGGVAVVAIDPVFAQAVSLEEPYHVFLQAYGDADLYVAERTAEGFRVLARAGGGDVEFSYRLVARRLGYEDDRLERAPWADGDPNLYPEKRAEWEAKHPQPGEAGGEP